MSLCAKFHTFVPICAMVKLTALTITSTHNLVATGCYPPEVANYNPSYVTTEVHDLKKKFRHGHTLEGCFVKFALIFSEKQHSFVLCDARQRTKYVITNFIIFTSPRL